MPRSLPPSLQLCSGRKWDSAQGCVPGPGNALPHSAPRPTHPCQPPASRPRQRCQGCFTAAERGQGSDTFSQCLSAGGELAMAGAQRGFVSAGAPLSYPSAFLLAPLILFGPRRAYPRAVPILSHLSAWPPARPVHPVAFHPPRCGPWIFRPIFLS